MEGINCNGEGGWTRVGYVNMAQPGATCPDGLIQKRYSNISYPLCSRPPCIPYKWFFLRGAIFANFAF